MKIHIARIVYSFQPQFAGSTRQSNEVILHTQEIVIIS